MRSPSSGRLARKVRVSGTLWIRFLASRVENNEGRQNQTDRDQLVDGHLAVKQKPTVPIAPKELIRKPEKAIAHQIGGKYLAYETPAAVNPKQDEEKQ